MQVTLSVTPLFLLHTPFPTYQQPTKLACTQSQCDYTFEAWYVVVHVHRAAIIPLDLFQADKSFVTACLHFLQEEVKILMRIGEGAFGEVSLATCAIFGSVAVKWLKVCITLHCCFSFATFALVKLSLSCQRCTVGTKALVQPTCNEVILL